MNLDPPPPERGRCLLLVRHAAPAPCGEDAAQWGLSAEGRAAAAALAERLAPPAGAPAAVDERLREVQRTWVPEGYRQVAARWLTGAEVPGWEVQADVAARMAAAVAGLPAGAYVVTHGLALTALVAPRHPVAFWRSLAMPDAREWSP